MENNRPNKNVDIRDVHRTENDTRAKDPYIEDKKHST